MRQSQHREDEAHAAIIRNDKMSDSARPKLESRLKPAHNALSNGLQWKRDDAMTAFRVLLVAMWVAIFGYTAIVVANQGMGLLPVFFGDMEKMGWPGQFNLDFMCMLALSALWVAWRHHFSGGGLVLAVLALFGGASFLCAYLLVVSLQAKGDVRELLLGTDRASV